MNYSKNWMKFFYRIVLQRNYNSQADEKFEL